MAIDFPSSPTSNQIYYDGSKSWIYNSTATAWLSYNPQPSSFFSYTTIDAGNASATSATFSTSDYSPKTILLGNGNVYTTISENFVEASRVFSKRSLSGAHISGVYGRDTGGFTANSTVIAIGNNVSNVVISGNSSVFNGNVTFANVINSSLTNPTITNYTEKVYSTIVSTSSFTVDLTLGTIFDLTISSSFTINMPTAVAGKSFIMFLKNPYNSPMNWSVSWNTVKWPYSNTPPLTATPNSVDIFSFFSDGINWYGTTVGLSYGYQ